MSSNHLFLIAGEQSGDLHASRLIKRLKEKFPSFTFSGVGGPEMRAAGLAEVARMEDFQIMGFTAVLKNCIKIIRQFTHVRDAILASQPEAVILVDYPGFNLRMAKALRQHGYEGRLIQYISPTFWAWGKGRIKKMERHFDLLMTIYPFENKLLVDSGLDNRFIGNPVWENIQQHQYVDDWYKILGIKWTDHLVALFPGSRKEEVENHLPELLEAAFLLKSRNPSYRFAISCSSVEMMALIHKIVQDNPLRPGRDLYLVQHNYRYELMRDCKTAIAKCGSVALELALHERPTIITYRVSSINRLIAKYILRIQLKYFSMPNILLNQEIFPELIREKSSPESLAQAFIEIDEEGQARHQCLEGCQKIKQIISYRSASDTGATMIMDLLRK